MPRPLDGGTMSHDDRDQPVKRTRATQECDPPGITGRVCDGLSWRRSDPSASNPRPQFGAFSHASKNSCIGARRTLACGSGPELHFTLNHYSCRDHFAPASASIPYFVSSWRPRIAQLSATTFCTFVREFSPSSPVIAQGLSLVLWDLRLVGSAGSCRVGDGRDD